jgi:uncharacterized beta barrel domain-containing protein DUF5777
MTTTFPTRRRVLAAAAALALAGSLRADEPDANASAAPPPKPPEGAIIIVLPSVDVPRPGTLGLLFTHRFTQPLNQSNRHTLFSFDSGADIGIGLSYAPVAGLDVSFYRSSSIDIYELAAKYHALTKGPFGLAVRGGYDWRTEAGAIFDAVPDYSRGGFFGQVVAAVDIGSRARFSIVPTYVSEMSGQPTTTPKAVYKDIFEIPAALSIRVTRSINVQAEVYPNLKRTDSSGVGWVVAIEKTLLRHRFAFTCGNMRATTVDQYVAPVPFGGNANDYYLGFNLVRQWSLK